MADPKIFIRRSATPNKVPTTNQLALGELAINTYDGKLYLEKDPGGVGVGTTVIAVNPWTVGVGSLAYDTYFTAGNVGIATTVPTATLDVNGTLNVSGIVTATEFHGNGSNITGIVSISDSSPSSPQAGDLWWESDTGELKVYYDENQVGAGTSSFWVSTNGADNAVAISTEAPSPATSGDLWWDSSQGNLFVYYNDGDSAQWVDATGLSGAYPWVITGAGIHTTSKVGIGTDNPQEELEVRGDAKIGIDTSQGVILTSPNGTEYRLIVDNSGNLSTVAV